MNNFYCEIIKSRGKYGKKAKIFWVKITDTIKLFCFEISSAFIFYARELNLVSNVGR